MAYYLVVNPINTNYKFIYGSENLDNIIKYINENKLTDTKILQYHLQGHEFYFEIRNEHFYIYNNSPEVVKPIQENVYKYGKMLDDIIEDLMELEFEERYSRIRDNENREELLNKKKVIEEKDEYYWNKYQDLYEAYGVAGDRKIKENDYKFTVINYFQ